MNTKQLVLNLPYVNGTFDRAACDAVYEKEVSALIARYSTDQDTIAKELSDFLIANPGLRNVSMPSLQRHLWDARVESGMYKGKSIEEKDAAEARLAEILPEYIRENPENFVVVKKLGVVINAVPGDILRNPDGSPKLDPNTHETIQNTRWSAEEWKKHQESAANSAEKAAAKRAEKDGGTSDASTVPAAPGNDATQNAAE